MRRLSIGLVLLALACGGGDVVVDEGGTFVYGHVQVEDAERPARFDTPPPADPATGWDLDDTHPPFAWLAARACAGDDRVLEGLLAAHREAGSGDAMYGEPVAWCWDDAYCDWSAERFPDATGPDRILLARFLSSCDGHDALFEDASLPDSMILARWSGYRPPPQAYSPRLGAAIRNLGPEPASEARMAAVAHGKVVDDRAAADLVVAYDRVTNEYVRGGIALGLRSQTTPDARARHADWCGQKPEDFACGEPYAYPDSAEAETEAEVSPAAARLVELGLAEPGLTSGDTWDLAEHGAFAFDTETGMWPNEHEGLLASLAHGVGGFEDAAFSEDVPGSTYTLHGYARGKHWWIQAEDLGDWYDIEAVLALLNTMARDLGKPTRWVTLETGDQMSVVLSGDQRAIETAVAEGILPVFGAGAAMEAGKAFEDEVLRAIEAGELDL